MRLFTLPASSPEPEVSENTIADLTPPAESILEQVISSSSGQEVSREDIEFILGLVETAKIDDILNAVAGQDPKPRHRHLETRKQYGSKLRRTFEGSAL